MPMAMIPQAAANAGMVGASATNAETDAQQGNRHRREPMLADALDHAANQQALHNRQHEAYAGEQVADGDGIETESRLAVEREHRLEAGKRRDDQKEDKEHRGQAPPIQRMRECLASSSPSRSCSSLSG